MKTHDYYYWRSLLGWSDSWKTKYTAESEELARKLLERLSVFKTLPDGTTNVTLYMETEWAGSSDVYLDAIRKYGVGKRSAQALCKEYDRKDKSEREWFALNAYVTDLTSDGSMLARILAGYGSPITLRLPKERNTASGSKNAADDDSLDISAFLLELISMTDERIQMIKEGTYRTYVEEKFPYSQRTGTISRRKLEEISPAYKEILARSHRPHAMSVTGNNETIGIVPAGIIPMTCHRIFQEGRILSFENLSYLAGISGSSQETITELEKEIKWFPLNIPELRGSKSEEQTA